MVPESPARFDDINDEQDSTSVQLSQIPLFDSNETTNVNRSPIRSGDDSNPQEILSNLKKKLGLASRELSVFLIIIISFVIARIKMRSLKALNWIRQSIR